MPWMLQSSGHVLALQLVMRVCLFWNRTAGGGASLEEITKAIGKAGHHIERVVHRPEELSAGHLHGVDCVAAAGGDGTVARAGQLLAGGAVPLAIIPLGTANNIASSLDIHGVVDEVVARWARRQVVSIDVGSIDGARHFFESVGCGLVTECIDEGRRTLSKDDPDDHLAEARQMYLDRLEQLAPSHYEIRLEDETIEGDYLAVEVLNTSQVGPGIELASNVSSSDGLLSVVALTERDRPALAAYLTALRDGRSPAPAFQSWRSRRVEFCCADQVHVDDLVMPASSRPIAITLKAGFLPILA
jgi:diacylglycerol kinase (ATP)